jgi:ABC-type nitrate/sulfonate/bicarbonate transport system permease component
LGFDDGMRVSVVAFAAWWAILLNTRSARQALDGTLLDAARSMGLGQLRRHVRVILPALLPAVLLGVRVATPIALVITLLAEYLTGTTGIGGLLGDAQRTFRPARVYGLIVAGTALSLMVDGAVATMQHAVTRRRTAT